MFRSLTADGEVMQERRSETRMMCADLVEVSWAAHGKHHKVLALLEDISASGACLQLESSVPVGAEMRWSVKAPTRTKHQGTKKEFSGCVRYCEYREIGYFVGVEFDARSKWSRSSYKPQHLLDLKHLLPRAHA
jgi:PilZ domain-containing protein